MYFYKDPAKIPEEYYTRIGLTKPGTAEETKS